MFVVKANGSNGIALQVPGGIIQGQTVYSTPAGPPSSSDTNNSSQISANSNNPQLFMPARSPFNPCDSPFYPSASVWAPHATNNQAESSHWSSQHNNLNNNNNVVQEQADMNSQHVIPSSHISHPSSLSDGTPGFRVTDYNFDDSPSTTIDAGHTPNPKKRPMSTNAQQQSEKAIFASMDKQGRLTSNS